MMAQPSESVPQRLKPEVERAWYGTAEAVPLSETLGVSDRGRR